MGSALLARAPAQALLQAAFDFTPDLQANKKHLKEAGLSSRNDPYDVLALARSELDLEKSYRASDFVQPLTALYPELVPIYDTLTLLDTAWNPPQAGAVQKQ